MSQLSTDTKVGYVAVYYQEPLHVSDYRFNESECFYNESECYDTEEEAIEEAKKFISHHTVIANEYLHARIEKRVVPIYE